MNQVAQPLSAGRWIGRVIVAVLVAEGVWGLIVSLTRDLIVPYLGWQMGGVSQPQQNVNVSGIFTAVIALCLAGLVAVLLNAWVNWPVRGRAVPVAAPVERASRASLPVPPSASQAPVAPAAPVTASGTSAPASAVMQVPSPPSAAASKPTAPPSPAPVAPKVAPVAPPPKPAKPKPPKEIQYTIVGEPISPMDEDE
jgi:hypothetical protein